MIRISTFIFILIAVKVTAQHQVYLRTTAGSYEMQDLKQQLEITLTAIENLGLEAQTADEFPWSLQLEAGYRIPVIFQSMVCVSLGYTTTRGKVGYEDQTGKIVVTHDLDRYGIDLEWSKELLFNFSPFLRVGNHFTRYQIQQEVQITNLDLEGDLEEDIFRSYGASVYPGVRWSRQLGKLAIQVDAGYEKNIYFGEVKLKEDAEIIVRTPNGDPAKIDWSGFRLGFGLALLLSNDN